MDWIGLAIQAGGAVGVCAMFLWFLQSQNKQSQEKDARFFEQLDKQTAYLKSRDEQSKVIALSGHEALRSVADQLGKLHEDLAVIRVQHGTDS